MTDDQLDVHLDNILKASGSALKHYSMQKTKDDMRQALRQAIAELESQEPVAWMKPDVLCDRACMYLCTKGFTQFPECATAPPQRTWVGLTDEEIDKTHETQVWDARRSYARAIEAKLKQKNGFAEEKNT